MIENTYGYIYKITNTINNKWYIGSKRCSESSTIESVRTDGYFGSGIKLRKAIAKYGKQKFTKSILCFCENAYEFEELLLSELNAASNRQSYNVTNQGCGWAIGNTLGKYERSEQTRLKISINNGSKLESTKIILKQKSTIRSANPEYIAKLKAALARPEVVEKMRQRSLNQVQTQETKDKRTKSINELKHKWSKPVLQFTMNDKFVAEFASITEAAKHLGKTDRKGISFVCNGKQKHAHGFKWSYK